MGIEACLKCPDAVRALQRTYTQSCLPIFDIDYPSKPAVRVETDMDVKAGCSLSGKVEGQGETSNESLQDALTNSETFVALNCPLETKLVLLDKQE